MKQFTGTREAFAAAIMDLAKDDANVMLVSPDSLKAMRATDFADTYPGNYIEVGIAEQCAVDVAAGMAASGTVPFVATYAGFLTMRACEQMRTFVAYPNLNVKFVGINAGLVGGEREGVTHQFYEDLAVLSAIPHFTIFTPAAGAQTYRAVKAAYEIDGPVYIRAGSGREPDVYGKEAPFSPEGVTVLKDYGSEVVLFAGGFILNRVLADAEQLRASSVNVTVADVNILYGKNNGRIIDLIKGARQVFTIEDHNINGGLGSYICHLACEHAPVHVTRIGLSTFGESGPADALADYYGFSAEAICSKVRNAL